MAGCYVDSEKNKVVTFNETFLNLDEEEMISLLDYAKYYDKLELPIPRNRDKVLVDFENEKFIRKNDAGKWDISNMGALMVAKDLKKFETLHRKTVRVIWYKGDSRLEAYATKDAIGRTVDYSAGRNYC